jgi:F0F1-type ATP synthase delta subunit
MSTVKNYANYLATHGESGVPKLLSLLSKKHQLGLLSSILRVYKTLARAQGNKSFFGIARATDETVLRTKHAIADSVATVIDPNIISGYVLKEGSTLTDFSGRKALVRMYQNIINS